MCTPPSPPCLTRLRCEAPHHGYVGDSLLGRRAHLGCGATTANLPLLKHCSPSVELPLPPVPLEAPRRDGPSSRRGGRSERDGGGAPSSAADAAVRYDLGIRKFGAVIGDGSQLGCGCVAEPGCLLAPNTHAYPLCRLPRGVYGPDELIKNRQAASGALVRAPLV